MTNALLSLLLAAIAAPAYAADFEVPIRYQPEPAFEQIIARAVEPLKARDAFAGLEECMVVDARTFRPVAAAQAEEMLAPCIAAVARRYNQSVKIERLTAAPEGSMTAQVEGLAIYVPEGAAITDPVMRDLNHALSRRAGRILGHPVSVRRAVAVKK